jgi:siroheme synthase-like protein
MTALPVCLRIVQRRCVVVGGGAVARRKAEKLLSHGARVVVVAREIAERSRWPRRVEIRKRAFRVTDVRGASLVIAATDDADANERVARAARARGVLVQRTDSPASSDFTLPATLSRGDLTVAFSTNGASPAFSARLRDEAGAVYGPAHAEFCRLLRVMRREAQAALPAGARRAYLRALVDAGLLEMLERNRRARAYALARRLLQAAKRGQRSGAR